MPLSELGAYLQRHREERNLTLDELEQLTRIRRRYLEAIEAGDWDSLPPSVYTRGLLRNYARSLGISTKRVLNMYISERPSEARLPEPQLISRPLIEQPRFNVELLLAIVLMLAAAGLFGWIIMTQLPDMLPQIAATSQEASASTPDDASDQAPADDTTQERQTTEGLSDYAAEGDGAGSGSSGSAAAGAAAGASARRTATPRGSSSGGTGSASTTGDDETRSGSASGSAGDDADEPASADDLVTPDTDAGNRSTPSASRMTQVAPLPTTTARASPTPHGLELLVRASSDTWIRVHTDGQEAYASFLYKGDSMTWRASESVRLRTGNAGGTEITINGQRIDKLGEGGAVEEREWRLLPNGDIEQREV